MWAPLELISQTRRLGLMDSTIKVIYIIELASRNALIFDPGWLGLIEYYSRAFKLGAYPPIIRDRIFPWSRPHPANLLNVPDNVSIPNNHEWVSYVPCCP